MFFNVNLRFVRVYTPPKVQIFVHTPLFQIPIKETGVIGYLSSIFLKKRHDPMILFKNTPTKPHHLK